MCRRRGHRSTNGVAFITNIKHTNRNCSGHPSFSIDKEETDRSPFNPVASIKRIAVFNKQSTNSSFSSIRLKFPDVLCYKTRSSEIKLQSGQSKVLMPAYK